MKLDYRDILYMSLIVLLFMLLMFTSNNCNTLVEQRDANWVYIIKECSCMCPNLQVPNAQNLSQYPMPNISYKQSKTPNNQ